MSTKELIDYLEHLVKIEAMYYEQQKSYDRIIGIINSLSKRKYTDKIGHESNSASDNGYLALGIIFLGAVIGLVISFIYAYSSQIDSFFLIKILKIIFFDLIILFNGIIGGGIIGGGVSLILMLFIYIGTKQQNKEIDKRNSQIAKNNAMMKKNDQRKIQLLKQEADILKKQCSETKKILNRAYNMNIIYPKYRSFVAVCSLYEYVKSGRCSTLEGHEGGYNIYENEMRLNLINEKLDVVIDKLDQIQQSQNCLYRAIMESNENVNKLYKQTISISEKLSDISQNNYISAYNTSIITRNTEYLKWVTYLKS